MGDETNEQNPEHSVKYREKKKKELSIERQES